MGQEMLPHRGSSSNKLSKLREAVHFCPTPASGLTHKRILKHSMCAFFITPHAVLLRSLKESVDVEPWMRPGSSINYMDCISLFKKPLPGSPLPLLLLLLPSPASLHAPSAADLEGYPHPRAPARQMNQ